MAAKFFTGLPLDGPDPECVLGHGEPLLAAPATRPRRARRSTTRAGRRPIERATKIRWPTSGGNAHGEQQRLVRVGRRGAAARAQAPARARSTTRCSPGAERGATLDDNVAAFGELGFVPRIATGLAAGARPGDHRAGPADLDAGDHLADRRPGGQPGRRGGRRARGGGGGDRDGAQLVREQADRGGRRGQPADVLPDVLAGHPRAHDGDHGARPGRRREGAHRHARLDVRAPPRLGQPADPRAARPARDGDASRRRRSCARGGCSSTCAAAGRRTSPRPNLAPPGGDAPTFFGAYGEWMQTPPPSWADIAWLREQWDGPVPASRA